MGIVIFMSLSLSLSFTVNTFGFSSDRSSIHGSLEECVSLLLPCYDADSRVSLLLLLSLSRACEEKGVVNYRIY